MEYNGQGFWVSLENTCPSTMSVQVVVVDGPSSSCITLAEGDISSWFSNRGKYARTAVC